MAMTYPTVTGEASTTTPLVLFFGPQYTHFTEKRLLELRKFIVGNTDLKPLLVAIKELPSLWPSLQQACLHLNSIPGAEQLDQLCQIFEAGTLPKVAGLNNLLLTPLTVISQIVEILCLGEKTESLTFPASFQADSEIGSVQGFCVGFLAAAAVASSRDKTEFQHYSSVALRLAVCIGSTVDRDEGTFLDPLDRSSSIAVRWKTDLEQAYFKRTLSSYSMVSLRDLSCTLVSIEASVRKKCMLFFGVFTELRLQKKTLVESNRTLIISCSRAAASSCFTVFG